MNKILIIAAISVLTLFCLISCGNAENGEKADAPDFTVLDSDESLDVKKVSLESLCDLSDMTFERIFGDDEEIKRYYTADDMRFINCFIVVTEDGIYRTFSTASSTPLPRKASIAKTFIEFYEPKYKITDLTLGGEVKIERAYRNTVSYHDPFVLGARAFGKGETLSQPKENCVSTYIYNFDAGEDARSTYEYFDISNGYPTPKSEDDLRNAPSATAFINYMWQVRGTGKQIFDFAAESTAESE